MAFQEKMSNSSYQRAVKDMRDAGINPALAFSQGGASTPGGQTAKMENVAGKAVGSALEARRIRREFEAMDSQIKLNRAQVGTQNALGEMYHANTVGQTMENQVYQSQLPAHLKAADTAKQVADMNKKYAGWDAFVGRASDVIGAAKGISSAARSWVPRTSKSEKYVLHDRTWR